MTPAKWIASLLLAAVLCVPVGCFFLEWHGKLGIASGLGAALFSPLLVFEPQPRPGLWRAIGNAFVALFVLFAWISSNFKASSRRGD